MSKIVYTAIISNNLWKQLAEIRKISGVPISAMASLAIEYWLYMGDTMSEDTEASAVAHEVAENDEESAEETEDDTVEESTEETEEKSE